MSSLIICAPMIIVFLFLKHVLVAPVTDHESGASLELPLSSYSNRF